MRNFLIVLLSLVSAVSLAQWRLPSRQSTVNTSYWGNLSPTADTVQAVFDYIDLEGVGGSGGYGTNTYVNPATWQYLLTTPTTPTGGIVSGFYLPGTNIVGATYNETNETWTVDTSQFITNIVFELGTGGSFSSVVLSGVATLYYPTNFAGE